MTQRHHKFDPLGSIITGAFAMLPLIFTIWVVKFMAQLAWDGIFSLAVPFTHDMLKRTLSSQLYMDAINWHLPEVAGFMLMIMFLLAVGIVARRFVGRLLLRGLEKLIGRIPGVNWIYSMIQQITSTFDPQGGGGKASFRQAVLVKVGPRAHMMAFLTNTTTLKGKKLLVCFIPCNQLMQGYNILIEPADAVPLDLSVDEAIKQVVSFGLVSPSIMRPEAVMPLHAAAKGRPKS